MTQPTVSKHWSSSPMDRLQSHQVNLTMLQYYTCMQYSDTQKINTYTKMNLSTVKWAQWDKTQSRELLDVFICVCIALCTIVAHNIAPKNRIIFPFTLQIITIALICLFERRGWHLLGRVATPQSCTSMSFPGSENYLSIPTLSGLWPPCSSFFF